jgi:hypothetical protein
MAQTIVADTLAELRERGLHVGARVGSTVRPRLFGTVCAIRMDSEYFWIVWDDGITDLVTEHEICPLFLREEVDDDLSEVA